MPPTELTTLPTPPSASDFIPLSDHQAQTPTTFFGGKPVLHAEFSGCDLLIRTRDAEREEFVGFNTGSGGVESGEEEGDGVGGMRVVSGVNGFVTSDSLLLVAPTTSHTLSIPYPSISLHATQRLLTTTTVTTTTTHTYHPLTSTPSSNLPTTETQAIYLQLSPSSPSLRDPATDEDDSETIELLLIPHPPNSTGENAETIKEIFDALSRCADLHPDAGAEGDEYADGDDEGMMGGMGGGGWITAENAHEFEGGFDVEVEDGGEEGLGEGAGRRRGRDEADGAEGESNGVGEGEEEAKWRRTG